MKHISKVSLHVSALIFQFVLSSAVLPAPQIQSTSQNLQTGEVVPGVVVVKFKRGYAISEGMVRAGTGTLFKGLQQAGVVSLTRAFKELRPLSDAEVAEGKVDLSRIYYAGIAASADPGVIARRLSGLEQVEYAEPKYVNYICEVPNDSAFEGHQQKYFDLINAPAGWAIAKGDSAVVIAAVDGGTNWKHPDIEPNLWINHLEDINHNGKFDTLPSPTGDLNWFDDDHNGKNDDVIGWNFGSWTNNPRGSQPDLANHGTGTASVFGAVTNNKIGMAGSSWNCRVMPICASLPGSVTIDFGYEGMEYAFLNGAKIINCSWGHRLQRLQYEQDVINAATEAGALVVVAAGDWGGGLNSDSLPWYPAAYDNVLSVGATTDTSDAKAHFSDYGVNITVFAPGVNIWSAKDNGSYGLAQGTSFSSPLVAGLAGILKSVHPSWTPRQLAKQIRMTADPIDGVNPEYAGRLGRGRVNFARALSESPAGIEVISSSLHTPSGRKLILRGDTLSLSVVVENVLSNTAHNISFVASSLDPDLQVLQGSAAIGRVDSGEQVSLPDFKFRVGSSMPSRTVVVKLEWVSNANERDARAFNTPVFGTTGYWSAQKHISPKALLSVKAVNREVAWAAGAVPPEPYTALVVRTTDGGESWDDVTGNLAQVAMLLCINAVDANRAWVGSYAGKIYATTNGGSSWSEQPYPGKQSVAILSLWFFDPDNGYALGVHTPNVADANTILQTTNGGVSWTHLANEPVAGQIENAWPNYFWWTDRDHGWFATNYNRVWRTTDGGASWSYTQVGDGSVAFRDNSTGLLSLGGGLIARTSDGGATWTKMTIPGVRANLDVTYAPGSHTAWMVDGIDGSYRSDDDGLTWTLHPCDTSVHTSPPNPYIHISFADSSNGWIVNNGGQIFHHMTVGVTGVPVTGNPLVPSRFALEQNYPNPFNGSTKIGYRVQGTGYGVVMLKVYDVLGRDVATLVNEVRTPGSYTVEWDAGRYATGVYFYRMRAGNFIETRKMLLLR